MKKILILLLICANVLFAQSLTTKKQTIRIVDVGGREVIVTPDGQMHVVLDGMVDYGNSSRVALGTDSVFIGAAQETLSYGFIFVNSFSDVASDTNGLEMQVSSDSLTWRTGDNYSVPGNKDKTYAIQPNRRFFRIRYTNGSVAQAVFDLEVVFKKTSSLPSSHRIQDSIVDEDDAQLVKAVLTALSEIGGSFENITSRRGALNVNSAWVYRKIVNETFHQDVGASTTPTVAIVADDTTITVASIGSLIVGSEIKLTEGLIQEIGLLTVTAINALAVKIDRPITNEYTTSAIVQEVTSEMAVNGSLGTPQIFEVDPPPGTVWQITRILISMVDNVAGDDSKFGGMAELTNGLSLRATTTAGRTVVFANWKSHRDMKLDMFNVEYTEKAGAGNHGVSGRWTFTTAEVVAELDGDADPIQKLEALVTDNLTANISIMIRAQGRVYTP